MITVKELMKRWSGVEWRDIPDYSGYALSNYGDVWDMDIDKIVGIGGKKDKLFVKLLGSKVWLEDIMLSIFKDSERWVTVIPPLMEYEVSSWGRVRRSIDHKILSSKMDKDGVERIVLSVSSRPLGFGTEQMTVGYTLGHIRVIDLMSLMFLEPSRMVYKALLKDKGLRLHILNIDMTERITPDKIKK